MGFDAKNIEVGRAVQEKNSPSTDTITTELTGKELELLLVTIKNGLFKGEYVETLYNLTLKLQKNFLDFKSKNLDV